MPGPISQLTTSGALKAGVIAEFNRSFEQRYKERNPAIVGCIWEVDSKRQQETHAGFQSLPIPKRWPKGQPRSRSALQEFYVSVTNYAYDMWIGWNEEDEEDDQTGKFIPQAQAGGIRFSQIDERILVQIVTNTTDPNLLPSIPNCYDGQTLVYGSARTGSGSGGNVLTGSGVGSGAAIRSDFQSAIGNRFMQFQDTESQPYWTESDCAFPNFVIFFNPANLEKFNDAFQANLLPAAPLGTAPVDNTYLARNSPQLFPTQRVTGNSYYIVNCRAPGAAKTIVKQNRRGLRQLDANPANSDEARDTKEKGVGWDIRAGFAPWEWRTIVQVSNG